MRGLYSIVSWRNTIELSGFVVPTIDLLLGGVCYCLGISSSEAFKWKNWRNAPVTTAHGSDTAAVPGLMVRRRGCKVQRAAGILSYPSEHLRLLIGRP